MPEHADEPAEYDWLLAFPTEPGGKRPESQKSLAARIECLEEALHQSERQVDLLKSELATLVGTVDDIRKIARRPLTSAPKPGSIAQTRFLTATAGVVFGLAVAMLGWALWSRDSITSNAAIDTIDPAVAAWAPVAEEPRVEATSPRDPVVSLAATTSPRQPVVPLAATTSPRQPVVPLAAATPQRVTEPTAAKAQRVQAPVGYVGTLSIEAAPGGQVFIDRKAAGQTPLRVENLKAGSHLVWIEREGYRRFTRVVQVPADRVSRVFAELESIPER